MALLRLLICLAVGLQAGQGAAIHGAPSRRAGFLSIEEMMHASSSMAAGNGTERAGASLANVLSSLEHEVQYELHLGAQAETEEPKNKILLAVIVGANLGFCGVDRCFFGQLGLGALKCLTCGGCFCWWVVDTIALIINFVMFSSSIDSLYMTGEFTPSSCSAAFWVWLLMILTQQIVFYKSSAASWGQALARRNLGEKTVGPPTAREIKALFKRFDKDGNGTLDYAELDSALRYLGVPDSKLALYKVNIDNNHDSRVDIQEFAAAMGGKDHTWNNNLGADQVTPRVDS